MERETKYITVEALQDMFDEYLSWVEKSGGRLVIQDNDTLEPIAVMISVDEAIGLGVKVDEDPE